MLIENKNIEKTCSFYVSDFHLEMILLPYINKKIEENAKIVIQSEKDLTDSINVLMSKTNLTDENKEKILDLGWNKNNNIQIEELSNIIVIGSKQYIDDKNREIEKLKINRVNVLDCYEFEEIKDDICTIKERYDKILNTLGNKNF